MKALIIAAGDGTRLQPFTQQNPKPLIKVFGLSLIERVILTAKMAGIREFLVVVGYFKEKIKKHLKDGSSYGVKIQYLENNDWEKGNAISVLKAERYLKEDFILMMADHIFDCRILEALIKNSPKGALTLVVDRRNPSFDDTKVFTKNDLIIDIGKKIKKYTAVDRGIFYCTPEIFKYLKKAIQKGKDELTDGIQEAAKENQAYIFDLTNVKDTYIKKLRKNIDLWCIDVDTLHDVKRLKKKLIELINKDASDILAATIHPLVENFLARVMSYLPITPNQLTFFINILAYLVTFFYLKGYLVWGIILSFIIGVLDGVDGKLARLKMQMTKIGELEHPFDFLFESSWILALGWHFSQTLSSLTPLFLSSSIIALNGFYRSIYDRFGKIYGMSLDMVDRISRISRRFLARRNVFNLIIAITLIFNIQKYSLWLVFILSFYTAIFYTIQAFRYLKD